MAVARQLVWLHEVFADVGTATAFLTRIPMPHPSGSYPPNFARAQRVYPVVGALIGASVGGLYFGLAIAGVPRAAAAAIALGASALLTGALHEDGLADLADGFGGGRDKAAKLEIMRDSRLGTYGTLAMLVSFVAKVSALVSMSNHGAFFALTAVHALSRGVLPFMARSMPYARTDGLGASAGRVSLATAICTFAAAVMITWLALPWDLAFEACIAAVAGAASIAVLATRQIGGQTGDVLGAGEQLAEVSALLLIAARGF
jgi:adenosylcobinamide-GDP ribazoletransferase